MSITSDFLVGGHFAHCDSGRVDCPYMPGDTALENEGSISDLVADMRSRGWQFVRNKHICPQCFAVQSSEDSAS